MAEDLPAAQQDVGSSPLSGAVSSLLGNHSGQCQQGHFPRVPGEPQTRGEKRCLSSAVVCLMDRCLEPQTR